MKLFDAGGVRRLWRIVAMCVALTGVCPAIAVAQAPIPVASDPPASSAPDAACIAAEQRWPTFRFSTDLAALSAYMRETPNHCSAHDAALYRIANLAPPAPPSGPPDPQRAAQADAALTQLRSTMQSCGSYAAPPELPDGATASDSNMRDGNRRYDTWRQSLQTHLTCRRTAVIVAEAVLTPAIPGFRPTVPQEQTQLRIAIDQYSAEFNRDAGFASAVEANWRASVSLYNARIR